MLHEMEMVVYDRKWLKNTPDRELYYMYRDLYHTKTDHAIITKYDLRYDITVIPPGMLGEEFVKTAGHFHPCVPGTPVHYPEVYQVLEGEATYLMQHQDEGVVSDVVVVRASKGDIVVIPPGYGHITINASSKDLKMANWVCASFSSRYEPIREKGGGAYYMLRKGFVRNPSYAAVPEIRYKKPRDIPEFGLYSGKDMYELVRDHKKLCFLTEPQKFTGIFSDLTS
jgi:glucose-6-phosphate isomerase